MWRIRFGSNGFPDDTKGVAFRDLCSHAAPLQPLGLLLIEQVSSVLQQIHCVARTRDVIAKMFERP